MGPVGCPRQRSGAGEQEEVASLANARAWKRIGCDDLFHPASVCQRAPCTGDPVVRAQRVEYGLRQCSLPGLG